MSFENITDVTLKDFRKRTAGKKVILLYPQTRYRNAFLAHFLQLKDMRLLYFRVPGMPTNLETWLTTLADELDHVLDGFSSNLRSAITTGSPTQMGEAFAADLAVHGHENGIVMLIDEFDRVPMNRQIGTFIEALVANLQTGIQIAINARHLSGDPWYQYFTTGEARVLGTEHRNNNVMFALEASQRPQLEVYAFGRGHVFVNGHEITSWDGALPRNLFFYFMDHPLVTRNEIFAEFWPNLTVKEATNVFHVTKRKISETISLKVQNGGSHELTKYSNGFYTPSDKLVRHYDASEFEDVVEQALTATSDGEQTRLLTQAIELYRDPFLQTVTMSWTARRRDYLKQLYVDALVSQARLQKQRKDWQSALGHFVRALKETPEREDIHREVMKLYIDQDMFADAARQYGMLEKVLTATLGIVPDPETRDLYEIIQSKT